MKRQGISLSLKDIKKLEDEWKKTKSMFYTDAKAKVQFNIINKTPECSDTWEFE